MSHCLPTAFSFVHWGMPPFLSSSVPFSAEHSGISGVSVRPCNIGLLFISTAGSDLKWAACSDLMMTRKEITQNLHCPGFPMSPPCLSKGQNNSSGNHKFISIVDFERTINPGVPLPWVTTISSSNRHQLLNVGPKVEFWGQDYEATWLQMSSLLGLGKYDSQFKFNQSPLFWGVCSQQRTFSSQDTFPPLFSFTKPPQG